MSEEERADRDAEERPRIKVTDRRLFDREGNPREPDPEVRETTAAPTGTEIGGGGTAAPSGSGGGTAAPPGAAGGGDVAAPPGATGGGGTAAPSGAISGTREPSPGASGAAEPAAAAGAGSAAGAAGAEAQRPGAPRPTAGRSSGAAPRRSVDELPRDFAAFIESQYFEAMLYLGAARHPHTGEIVEDLDLARYKIDILDMLQDKTEGNLTADERNLLEEALYQLRMIFAQKHKSGSG